jgi:hypothetical protein
MGLIVATTPYELDLLPIHDAWFDADDLVHDEQKRRLTIPFMQDPEPSSHAPEPELIRRRRRSIEYRAPLVGWRLTIFNVRAVRASEGWADMGMLVGVSYSGKRRMLTIESNGKLEVVVDALRVEASGGDEVAAWKRRRVGRFGDVSDTPWR